MLYIKYECTLYNIIINLYYKINNKHLGGT